jgi:PEGA domain
MVMHMSKCLTLLVITLVLITGCITPVPKDTPADIQTTGSVEVSSTPPGAEVYLDNVFKGTTPVTIIEQSGSHIIELRLREHQSWSKSIQIVEGTKVYIDTALAPVPVLTSIQTTVLMVTTPTTAPTPWPRTLLGCFQYETYGWIGTGERFNLTEILWFQPAGVGLINNTFIFPPPKKPEVSLTGYTWSRDPATGLITVTLVGGGPQAEVYYNGNNDTITFSNINMKPTIFWRVPC